MARVPGSFYLTTRKRWSKYGAEFPASGVTAHTSLVEGHVTLCTEVVNAPTTQRPAWAVLDRRQMRALARWLNRVADQLTPNSEAAQERLRTGRPQQNTRARSSRNSERT